MFVRVPYAPLKRWPFTKLVYHVESIFFFVQKCFYVFCIILGFHTKIANLQTRIKELVAEESSAEELKIQLDDVVEQKKNLLAGRSYSRAYFKKAKHA